MASLRENAILRFPTVFYFSYRPCKVCEYLFALPKLFSFSSNFYSPFASLLSVFPILLIDWKALVIYEPIDK